MLRKRIIPCLDVKAGKVVKGVQFEQLRDMGDPAAHARFYNDEGADELAILDITASREERKSLIHVIEAVADSIFIPLTVGGGISTAEDVRVLLNAGADRVSLNTRAVQRPELITEAADRFGSQCVVAAIDVKRRLDRPGWDVYIYGGKERTKRDGLEWAEEVERRGAGEILLTSMDRDGTQAGYDVELLKAVTSRVRIPVIASGGAGKLDDFVHALKDGLSSNSISRRKECLCDDGRLFTVFHWLCQGSDSQFIVQRSPSTNHRFAPPFSITVRTGSCQTAHVNYGWGPLAGEPAGRIQSIRSPRSLAPVHELRNRNGGHIDGRFSGSEIRSRRTGACGCAGCHIR
jgi:cyclase